MDHQSTRSQRCAIYTRKSTEAGLDREINSLEAQRDTCSAYIKSQRHKGWVELPQSYDDGGFSGGTLNRPALQKLLTDMEGGRIDVVVIYKIDRLTRSLLDFVRLIDTMQRFGVSFVSITQSFDTTDSMGRLILNVLLTFAQFEREMIGDRLRDKFAVMKRRGKWVGGREPFGFRKEGRRLLIDEAEAAIIQSIYDRYALYPSGRQLMKALQSEGVRSKLRITSTGRVEGGRLIGEGLLHKILTNPIYLGKIVYQDEWFDGEHEAIVSQEQWDRVQALRAERHAKQVPRHPLGNLLLGILHDSHGRRMDVDTVIRKEKRFRYYATRRNREPRETRLKIVRVDAMEVEELAAAALRSFLCDRAAVGDALSLLNLYDGDIDRAALRGAETAARLAKTGQSTRRSIFVAVIKRAEVSRERLRVFICCHGLRRLLVWDGGRTFKPEPLDRTKATARVHVLDIPVALVREINATYLPLVPSKETRRLPAHPHLVRILEQGRRAQEKVFANRSVAVADLARAEGMSPVRYARLVKLNYLAPDIVAAILDGRHPPDLTVRKLLLAAMPLDWGLQRQLFGFEPRHDVGGSLLGHNDWRRSDAAYYDALKERGTTATQQNPPVLQITK